MANFGPHPDGNTAFFKNGFLHVLGTVFQPFVQDTAHLGILDIQKKFTFRWNVYGNLYKFT
jgi:hypothetical protein